MLTTLPQAKINFTSEKISSATLKQRGLLKLPVVYDITKLSRQSPEDTQAVFDIQRLWSVNGVSDPITDYFFGAFMSHVDYGASYCLEKPGKQSLGERIVGVFELYGNQLTSLRANPHNGQKTSRKLGGIGEVLFGQCLDLARKKGHYELHIDSVNDDYYRYTFNKAKMVEGDDYEISPICKGRSDIYLKLHRCDSILKRLNREYKTSFSTQA